MSSTVVITDVTAPEIGLKWDQGDSDSFVFRFLDEVDNPIDMSGGSTFVATIRRKHGHAGSWAFSVDTSQAHLGQLTLTAPTTRDLPARGVYDIRQFDGASKQTLVRGPIYVERTVSEDPS